jgi:hypothetical protein
MSKNPALLFHPNPPEDEGDLRRLFHNREIELENALEILLSGAIPPLPLAVHGPTRSGKSHFARYLVVEAIAQGAKFEPIVVQASDKSTARRVLAKIYSSLLKALPNFPETFKTEDAQESWYRDLKEFHDLLPLIEDPARQIEVEYSESEARQKSSKFGFSLTPSATLKAPVSTTDLVPEPKLEGKLEASHSRDNSQGQTKKVRWAIALPTDDHVVSLILQLLELRRRVDDVRRVLILVDDLDLLDPRLENGGECSVLLDRLGMLAASRRCAVVVTVRTQSYNGREKELQPLAEIGTWESAAALLAVYAKRIECFNDGEVVFDGEALRWLANRVEGRVGMFLQHCQEIRAKVAKAELPVTLARVRTRLNEQLLEWRRNPELVFIIERVDTEVRAGRQQVAYDEELPPNPLLLRLLAPIVGKKATYSIEPLYVDAIRSQQAP